MAPRVRMKKALALLGFGPAQPRDVDSPEPTWVLVRELLTCFALMAAVWSAGSVWGPLGDRDRRFLDVLWPGGLCFAAVMTTSGLWPSVRTLWRRWRHRATS